MTPIAEQISKAVEDIPGWAPQYELCALFNLGLMCGGDIVEIGSWCGRSSTALAMAARLTGKKVYCIDLFPKLEEWQANSDGSRSIRALTQDGVVEAFHTNPLWKEPYERDVVPFYQKHSSPLEVFNASMERNGLTHSVFAYRGTAEGFSSKVRYLDCRLAFLDGDHDYGAVCRDIDTVERLMQSGSWICFDDAFTCYEGVNQAIKSRILSNPRYDVSLQLTRKLFAARMR